MTDMTQFLGEEGKIAWRMLNGMLPSEAEYMRGGMEPAAGSVPKTTSVYLNSPIFRDAFTNMSLRRFGADVPNTYDIPDMVRALADTTDYMRVMELFGEERQKNSEFRDFLDARKKVDLDVERAEASKEGTFGAAVYEWISQSGMDMKFMNNYESLSDFEFVNQVMTHTHDVQHILTGFGPNLAGEQALSLMVLVSGHRFMSPELANVIHRALTFVTSSSFARTGFHYPEGVLLMYEAAMCGIEAGMKIKKPLFMIDYPAYYDMPTADVCAELGFKRGPGKEWDISEITCTDRTELHPEHFSSN